MSQLFSFSLFDMRKALSVSSIAFVSVKLVMRYNKSLLAAGTIIDIALLDFFV